MKHRVKCPECSETVELIWSNSLGEWRLESHQGNEIDGCPRNGDTFSGKCFCEQERVG